MTTIAAEAVQLEALERLAGEAAAQLQRDAQILRGIAERVGVPDLIPDAEASVELAERLQRFAGRR